MGFAFLVIEDRSFVRPLATRRSRAETGYTALSDRLTGN
jgi:hypothetical protein